MKLRPRYLELRPDKGLANRLRALGSALWVADALGLQLVLDWRCDEDFAAPFRELFRNDLDQDLRQLDGLTRASFVNPPYVDAGQFEAHDVLAIVSHEPFSHDRGLRPYSFDFWSAIRPHLLRLEPVTGLRSLVDRVHASFAAEMLGVHVRRQGPFAARSTDAHFFDEIDRMVAERPRLGIYLASDSPAVVDSYGRRYGRRLLTLDGPAGRVSRNRSEAEAARMALVDMLLLSRCERILGTHFSSFTELAGILGATPFKRIGGRPGEPGCDDGWSTHLAD